MLQAEFLWEAEMIRIKANELKSKEVLQLYHAVDFKNIGTSVRDFVLTCSEGFESLLKFPKKS